MEGGAGMSTLQIIAIVAAVTYGGLTAAASVAGIVNKTILMPLGVLGAVFGVATASGAITMQFAEAVGLYTMIVGLLGIVAVAIANGIASEHGPTISHHVVRAMITAAIIFMATT